MAEREIFLYPNATNTLKTAIVIIVLRSMVHNRPQLCKIGLQDIADAKAAGSPADKFLDVGGEKEAMQVPPPPPPTPPPPGEAPMIAPEPPCTQCLSVS